MRISLLIEQKEIMAELRSKMEVCGSFIDKERNYYLKQIEGLELEIDKLRESLENAKTLCNSEINHDA